MHGQDAARGENNRRKRDGSDQEDDMEQDPDMGEQVSTANVEPFIPREMTEDDKRLVKAMSKLSNDLLED